MGCCSVGCVHARLLCAISASAPRSPRFPNQERAELAASQKAELGALLEARAELEAAFMAQYLGACEAAEEELEALRRAGGAEHAGLRRRLEGEVAALQGHLEGARRAHALNADRLDYNHRVLGGCWRCAGADQGRLWSSGGDEGACLLMARRGEDGWARLLLAPVNG